jgi:tRNA nucleotidyltransferase (CCA-adding enzyme)
MTAWAKTGLGGRMMPHYDGAMKTYLVGGAVRDKLLGLPVQDRDYVVVGATPAEMESRGFRLVGADFPVFLHPETKCEYALARTERKTGPGYKGFAINAAPDVTLEQDLARRDLTINAMAESDTGELIDPYGGARDLALGILRHVSPAFAEDPLRILRVARFAARFDFKVADETLALMRDIVGAGEVEALVPERVWSEIERALGEKWPVRFIEVLRTCGALARLLPEVERLFGVPQPEKYHPEVDSGVHTLMVLAQAARLTSDTRVRFAALVHDLGKGTTPKADWPHHYGHDARGVPIIENLAQRLRVPNEHRDLAMLVSRYHLLSHRVTVLKPSTLLKMLEALDVFRKPARLEGFLLACEADARGRAGREDSAYPQAAILRHAYAAASSVSGAQVMVPGLSGPDIGARLREARIDAIRRARQP